MASKTRQKGGITMAQRLDYSDGYYYGEVEGGEENGFGIFYWNSGNRYEGDWLNGQMHGFGTMYYANGDKYEGYWKEHAKHGQGAYYYADGDTQFGYWSEGAYQGFDDPDDAGYDDGGSYYDDSDDSYDYEPTAKQSKARNRLRRGLGGGSSKPTKKSAPKASGFSKSSGTGNKKGKGKLIARIVFKSICQVIGLLIIIYAIYNYIVTEGKVPEEERTGALIGLLFSGGFSCGIWLFYYGTLVALKKSGLAVVESIKDPSFWEVVSVTTTTTYYSDGTSEKKSYSNIRGSFFGLLVMFFVVFGLIQTYYLVAAPILGPISLIKDIKKLRTEY